MQTRQEFIVRLLGLALVVLFVSADALAAQKPKEWDPVTDPARFVTGVDNPYFPLTPGRAYQFQEKGGDESFRVEVSWETKTILRVRTIVVREIHKAAGQTVETAENWFAQDRLGNVWYFGEATREYENGVIVSTAGSWEAGVGGALPGIIMKGHPMPGDTYFQEYAPGVAEDMASVMDLDRTEATPLGSYANVLRTKEWTPLESNSIEHKYYAPGVGLIVEVKGSQRLELVSIQ